MSLVARDYIDGLPPHISRPESASLIVMTEEEFQNLDDAKALEIFATQNIVTTGRSVGKAAWNEDTLSRLAHLDAVIDMQGWLLMICLPEMFDG
jgi:hypothetical protein